MSGPWAQSFADLSPSAIRTLRAMALLDAAEVIPAELAAALAVEPSEIGAMVEVLKQRGWVATTRAGADRLVDEARNWLTNGRANPDADEAAAMIDRYLSYQAGGLDVARHGADMAGRWASEQRDGIVRAIRAAVRVGMVREAGELATAAWQVADRVRDPSWWHELASHGEDAATQGNDTPALIALLNRSAVVFDGAEDLEAAEAQWVRALKLSREMGDHERTVEMLTALAGLYRKWGRLEDVLDALLELADAHQATDDVIARAEALAELGYANLAAGRTSLADTYLSRADELMTGAGPGSVPATVHARVLEQWGRALWRLSQTIRARRCFTRGLSMVADLDEAAALRLGVLLATHSDDPTLPDE